MRDGCGELYDYIQEEVKKIQGIYIPVKAGLLRRALIRRASWRRLHPNPEDEFCDPKIGPNEEIIGHYKARLFQMEGHLWRPSGLLSRWKKSGRRVLIC